MGNWTGYDTTNESDGFSWEYFTDKWDLMLGQIYSTGLFFIVPIGIAGMFLLYRASARVAAVMTLWFVPGVLLYTAYYWGNNTNGVGYLRFFLTLFPPIVVCAAWLLDWAGRATADVFRRPISISVKRARFVSGTIAILASATSIALTAYFDPQSESDLSFVTMFLMPVFLCGAWVVMDLTLYAGQAAAPIAAGIVVAITAGLNVYSARGPMERDFTIQTNLADTADRVLAKAKDPFETDPTRRPILFGETRNFLNYMQYAGNFECYAADAFSGRGGNRMWRNVDPDAPNPLQQARVKYMKQIYQGKSDDQLWAEGMKIVSQAIANNRHVYVALTSAEMFVLRNRFAKSDYDLVKVQAWREPVTMSKEGSKALMALGQAAAFVGRATPQFWEMAEVVKKPPAPPRPAPSRNNTPPRTRTSTTRPATSPSTKPTTAPLFEIR
jgi:hypothetical protein